jgi:hypothetical protein
MTKKITLWAGALAALTLALTANAAQPRTPAPAQKQAREKFHVHGGNCSRSVRLLGSYDSAEAACWAASDFRAKKLVRVRVSTGNLSPWSNTANSYSVYARTCKAFSLRGSTGFGWKAALLGELARRNRDEVEIIYHGDVK